MTHHPDFDGKTYDRVRDHERLAGQLDRVRAFMADGRWRALSEIRDVCGGTEAAVSARLRDLRKEKFGARIVERRHVSRGLWEYRVLPAPTTTYQQMTLSFRTKNE